MRPLLFDLDRRHMSASALEAECSDDAPERADTPASPLWSWLELLAWQMPLTPARVGAVLSVTLQRQEDGSFCYRNPDPGLRPSGEPALSGPTSLS